MFEEPTIVMNLELLPQQRVHLVVDLPERPTGFRGYCQWNDPMPEKDCPKGSPRNVEFLSSVEWAWSPMHSRWDGYFLNPRGRCWLLWIHYLDDNEWAPKWRWNLYAWGLRTFDPVSPRVKNSSRSHSRAAIIAGNGNS